MSICLDPTHLVTCLLINFPQLLSLVNPLLICSLYNLLVFAVPCGFVDICRCHCCKPCAQSCLVPSPALCPVLPCAQSCLVPSPALCPVQPCVQSSLVSSPARLPFCFFPYGVVFVCLFILCKINPFSSCNGSSLSSITGTWHTQDGFGEYKDTKYPHV